MALTARAGLTAALQSSTVTHILLTATKMIEDHGAQYEFEAGSEGAHHAHAQASPRLLTNQRPALFCLQRVNGRG